MRALPPTSRRRSRPSARAPRSPSCATRWKTSAAAAPASIEAAQKLGLTAVTIDAVDRSGRAPNGQPVANIPPGLDVVSQAFNSDVGVDNDPISFKGGYVWYDVLGITPSRDRNLDEVSDQVEARWREDQIASQLKAKATEMVQKLEQGGKLADEAAAIGRQGRDRQRLQARRLARRRARRASIAAAFRTAKDGVGQTAGDRRQRSGSCSASPTSVDPAGRSPRPRTVKKLKDSCSAR